MSFADVTCDYLDVTCNPELSFVDDLCAYLEARYPVKLALDGCVTYQVGHGVLKVERRPRFHRASASGTTLAVFREDGVFAEYLSLLSGFPHAVTRLDAALDVAVDTPPVLRSLERLYPRHVSFTRKPLAIKTFYSVRDDGLSSGTWYAGLRSKAAVTARVYDKQLEQLERYDRVIGPLTRYELTFRRSVGATLRDAYMPASLFYEYASPVLLSRPDDVPSWAPHSEGWESVPVSDVTFDRVLSRVEESPEIAALAALCSRYGSEGEEMLVRVLRERVRALRDGQGDSDGSGADLKRAG